MTIAEIADDACINCGEVKPDTRTIEPWGVLCSDCDEAMADLDCNCNGSGLDHMDYWDEDLGINTPVHVPCVCRAD